MNGINEAINPPFFSFISFAAAGVSGVCSAFGVSTASSPLALVFCVAFAFGLTILPLLVGSEIGVLGVDSLSLVAVLGVFAGYIVGLQQTIGDRARRIEGLTFSSPPSLSFSFFRFLFLGLGSGTSSSRSMLSPSTA